MSHRPTDVGLRIDLKWESAALHREERVSVAHDCGDRRRVGAAGDIQFRPRKLIGQLDAGVAFVLVLQQLDELALAVRLASECNGGGRPAFRMGCPEILAEWAYFRDTVVTSILLRSSAEICFAVRIARCATIVAALAMTDVIRSRACCLSSRWRDEAHHHRSQDTQRVASRRHLHSAPT